MLRILLCLFAMLMNSLCFITKDEMIKRTLYLSQATYCNDSVITNWSCRTCDSNVVLTNIIMNHGERALVGLYPKDKILFVAFRGSTNIQNWIDNVQFSKTCPYEEPYLCVETGFYKVFEYMKEDVIKSVETLIRQNEIEQLLFTGHSMGSCVSALMAYHMYGMTNKNITLYTFGSPRLGNEAFSDDFPIESTRVTHANDMVVHVPQMFLGYKHISHEVWYDSLNNKQQECNDVIDEDLNCSNSCSPLHCTSINDHLNYLNISLGSDGYC